MSNIIFISGPIKSGKSDFAEYLAKGSHNVTYIALSEAREDDKDWQKRINKHKLRRPKDWKLIETTDLIKVLKTERNILLIDSIGGFVVESLYKKDKEWSKHLKELINNLQNYKNKIIIVGEQSGWGLVSEHKLGNIFLDRIGETLKEITKISFQNWLTINGKAVRLDNIFVNIP